MFQITILTITTTSQQSPVDSVRPMSFTFFNKKKQKKILFFLLPTFFFQFLKAILFPTVGNAFEKTFNDFLFLKITRFCCCCCSYFF